MGVCYLQHRSAIGLFNNNRTKIPSYITTKQCSLNGRSGDADGGFSAFCKAESRRTIFSLLLAFYVLLLITIITVANKLPVPKNGNTYILNVNIINISTAGTHFGIRQLTSCWVLAIILYLIKARKFVIKSITRSFGIARGRYFRHMGSCTKVTIFLSFWITIMNLLLIIITLPAIKNPGPTRPENLSCLYQNVRGFVPISGLSKKIPPLDRNKLNDFQAYVYDNKPSVILLTETWLAKEHLDNEIFPNDTYRCFRLDRSTKTHPPDPLNKNKYKEKGGGVLKLLGQTSPWSLNKLQSKVKQK